MALTTNVNNCLLPTGAALLLLASTANLAPARTDNGFPFGMEMTLEAAAARVEADPRPGHRR
jgi:hypothetical protein